MADVSNVLLSGVVGSTAYGLAREGSDVDRLGVFTAWTPQLLGLAPFTQHSVVSTAPDAAFHEARKYLLLVAGGNPTASELLWLGSYEVETPLGSELWGLRRKLLCAREVRASYLGYAVQQFRKLEVRGDGSFSADTRKRTSKHARHLKRLCWQGYELYVSGSLPLQVPDPQEFHDFGDAVADGDIELARRMLELYEDKFNRATTVLPEKPDYAAANDWLLRVRLLYWA